MLNSIFKHGPPPKVPWDKFIERLTTSQRNKLCDYIECCNDALPRWPQMIVTGAAISEKRALEIIRRTDRFFVDGNGNDAVFKNMVYRATKHPRKGKSSYFKSLEGWEKAWGYINTRYVRNEWVSTNYILGPHGWCHPDGAIDFGDEIGCCSEKIDVRELYNDWAILAQEFPFLEVEVTLMSAPPEYTEAEGKFPVISFLVRRGEVTIIDPTKQNIHHDYGRVYCLTQTDAERCERSARAVDCERSGEHIIPETIIRKWGAKHAPSKGRMKTNVQNSKSA
jgi:hypothetical protein